MNTFPSGVRTPNLIFSDELSDEAVLIGQMASGYPLINKLFTFDPRTFDFEMPAVPEADKLDIMTFYADNKDVPFYWLNRQDGTVYEVVFISKPGCRVEGRGDLWRIHLILWQSTP